MARKDLAGFAVGALAVLFTAASALGFSTRQVRLNLGPGDAPFVSGFAPESEIEDKVGWHWTTYVATVDLPFEARDSDIDITLRYARVFGEEAVVKVSVGGVPTETFRARGGEIKSATWRAPGVRGPLVVALKVDSHERRDMGLKLDRLALDVASGPSLRLRWGAALRPTVAALLLFAGLLVLGGSPAAAGALTLVGALAFAARAWSDLFGAWRQASLAPEMLIVSTLLLLLVRKGMERRLFLEKEAARCLATAGLATMLLRFTLISHPDFYYPDLLTHARVVDAIAREGPSFFLHPADALTAQGAWTKPVLGRVSALPYAVMFHTPFAVLARGFDLSTDRIETALKAGSTLISVLPILLGGALAARLSLPPLSALVLCVIPTYTSRLSFALLPALFGHVFDLIALLTIANVLSRDGMKSMRSVLQVAAALSVGHLAYTSGVVNEAAFAGVLAGLFLIRGRSGRPLSARLLLAEALAALLAFGLYYRHFVEDVSGLVGRVLGLSPSAVASVYPIESFWSLLLDRASAFFGWPYVGLALVGLVFAGSVARQSKIVHAWVITYLFLILLRARIPDLFRYGHETLLITPLVAILGGSALVLTWERGGAFRLASVVSGLALSLFSFWQQWLAVAEQLGNAR